MSVRRCGRIKAIPLLLAVAAAGLPGATGAQVSPHVEGDPAAVEAIAESEAGGAVIQVPSGGRPLVVSRVDAIPRQLRVAIERAKCNLTDALIEKYPVLIFRPADGRRVMAVTPCFAVTPDSRAFLFERSVADEPRLMAFPVVARTGGISASSQPGLMLWEPQSMTLTAWRGSDHCPGRELRHVYRQGGGELNGFVLSRIEHRQLRCTTPEADWQTLWQAPAWNLQP